LEKNEFGSIESKSWEELADLEAYKKAGKDCCQWFLDSVMTQHTRRRGTAENMPSIELVYRELGLNLENAFTAAVLENMVEEETEYARGEPHFTSVESLIAFIERLNGWKDQQVIADAIQAHIELEKKNAAKYVTEIGEDFNRELIKYLTAQQPVWDKKSSDQPPNLASLEVPSGWNLELHGILEALGAESWRTYLRLNISGNQSDLMIAKPESIAGVPIERPKSEPSLSSVENISAYLKHLEKQAKAN